MTLKKLNAMQLNKENCKLGRKNGKYYLIINNVNIFCYITEAEASSDADWRSQLEFTDGNFGIFARYQGLEILDV